MNIFFTAMALLRPIIFIVAIIGIGILTIKLSRYNEKKRTEAFNRLMELPPNELEDEKIQVAENDITDSDEAAPEFIRPREIDINELVIPDNFMFKEEIEILKYMATKYPDECKIFLYEPVSAATISMYEQRMGIKFTDELKALYTFTNGMEFSLCTLSFESLQAMENMYKIGYCDFEKEGDAKDYIIVGGYLGCGDSIIMEKSTGNLFRFDHEEGEKSEPYTVKELLYWAIEFRADDLDEDERINQYLGR